VVFFLRKLLEYFLKKIGFGARFPRVAGLINGWYEKNILSKGLPLLKESIKEIKSESQKYHAGLYVCLIPSPLQVYPNTYGPILEKTFPNNPLVTMWLRDKLVLQQVMKKICEELSLPFLDLYPILSKKNNQELYIPNEGHFTKEGHAIAAASLADFIR
jgi:lysophospholipase L1-like esterase